jgi:hypothetical protein
MFEKVKHESRGKYQIFKKARGTSLKNKLIKNPSI